ICGTYSFYGPAVNSTCYDFEEGAFPDNAVVSEDLDVNPEIIELNTCDQQGDYVLGFEAYGIFGTLDLLDEIIFPPHTFEEADGAVLLFDRAYALPRSENL